MVRGRSICYTNIEFIELFTTQAYYGYHDEEIAAFPASDEREEVIDKSTSGACVLLYVK